MQLSKANGGAMMKDRFTIVYDWMLNLGLSTTLLLCYAIIYGFSSDGSGSFNGSRAYLARKMGAKSKRTVDKALLNLIALGLILKTEKNFNGIKLCEYRVSLDHVPTDATDARNVDTGANSALGGDADCAYNNKEQKNIESISPSSIAREVCPSFSEEFYELVNTLSNDTQWQSKSETQWRFNLKLLANVPEIEACEMIRRTIRGGWKGFYVLKAEDKSALYEQSGSPGICRKDNRSTTIYAPHKKMGILASEAIVASALEEFNNN